MGLPRTAERIVETLARAGRYLPVKELVKRVKMSERSVRKHLLILIRRGLLRRRAVHGSTKRVAYEYCLPSAQEMLVAAKRDIGLTLRRLETAVKGLGGRSVIDSSPKSASSSRS